MQRFGFVEEGIFTAVEWGEWCKSSDVAKLEAENEALHAECDRLTAMLGPQKALEAHEVTEKGSYWHRFPPAIEWRIVQVISLDTLRGQFVGPLKTPEV